MFGKQSLTDNLIKGIQDTAKDLGDNLEASDLKLDNFEVKQGSLENLLGEVQNTAVDLGASLVNTGL